MARAKKRKEDDLEASDPWASMELTPEERHEGRVLLQREIDRARADGAYERLAAMRGKIKWQLTDEEVRGK